MLRKDKIKIIALIPARGGSKGLKMKNIRLLGGEPLIHYTISAASRCPEIERVVVSTDNEEIRAVAMARGAEAPFLRPSEISGDNSTDLECLEHFVAYGVAHPEYDADIIVHLRPTSPFRDPADLSRAIAHFLRHYDSHDSLRSVHAMTGKHPMKTYYIDTSSENETAHLRPFVRDFGDLREPFNLGRQLLPRAYEHDGNIDIIKKTTVLNKKSVSGDRILAYVTEKAYVDIDTEDDLVAAEAVLLTPGFRA
jgi:N-acylneuraminate cytidylyltransferase